MAIKKVCTLKIFETLHSVTEMSMHIHVKHCPLLLSVNARKIIIPSTHTHTQNNISLYHCSVYAHKIILPSVTKCACTQTSNSFSYCSVYTHKTLSKTAYCNWLLTFVGCKVLGKLMPWTFSEIWPDAH